MTPLSLVPLFETDPQAAEEIAQEVDGQGHATPCNRHDANGTRSGMGAATVAVRPILTLLAKADANGHGTLELLDVEVLPDILSDATKTCIWNMFEGYTFAADYGPYEYRFKHLFRYRAPAALLRGDSPDQAQQRKIDHANNPPDGIY